jgi:hypothetical protein
MAWQLIYTSAPELLQAGRSGFGTVAKHEAIRPSLQTELERISQFSREDGLEKDRVIFSHRVLDLRGERFHVLSRISDAGFDYTGRTNHIAHHIVLTADEATQANVRSCTPADMIFWFTANDRWINRWNEPARLLTPSEEIATGTVSRVLSLRREQGEQGAVTWREFAGPAANAAILAPGGGATEACWPIFPNHWDEETRLRLIGESLCLHLDPWTISFSTDTQPTDRIEELRWRGVSAGSPVERTARQSVRPVLDLGAPSSFPSPEGPYAHEAETGQKKTQLTEDYGQRASISTHIGITKTGTQTNFPQEKSKASVRGESNYARLPIKPDLKSSFKKRDNKLLYNPVTWIVFGLLVVIILLWIVSQNCVFDNQQLAKIQISTDYIIKTSSKNRSSLDNNWCEKQVDHNVFFKAGGCWFVKPNLKDEIRITLEKLTELRKSLNTPEFDQNLYNAKNSTGLLGAIIQEIVTKKSEAEAAAAKDKRKKDEEIENQKRIAREKEAAQKKADAEAQAKVDKEREQKEQLAAVVEQEKKSHNQKLESIRLFPYGDNYYSELFPNNKLPAGCVEWAKVFHVENPLDINNALASLQWDTNTPFSQLNFKTDLENSDYTYFATKDANGRINLKIIFKANNSAQGKRLKTQEKALLFKDDGLISVKESKTIDQFIRLLPLGGYNLKYDIVDNNESIVELKKGIKTTFSADSPENLATLFNNTRRDLEQKAIAPVVHADAPQNQTEDSKRMKTMFCDAGNFIYGPSLISKEYPTPNYTNWLKSRAEKSSEANYIKYISDILGYTAYYFTGKNSGQSGALGFGNLRSICSQKYSIAKLFDSMLKQAQNFEEKLDNSGNYGRGSDQNKERDKIFINNLKVFFNTNNIVFAEQFFPKEQPDLQKPFKDGLKDVKEITTDLSLEKPANFKAIIRVNSGTNPLLFITP